MSNENDAGLSLEAEQIAMGIWRNYQSSGNVSTSDVDKFHQKMREIEESVYNIAAWKGILFQLSEEMKAGIRADQKKSSVIEWNSRIVGFLKKFPGMGSWLGRRLGDVKNLPLFLSEAGGYRDPEGIMCRISWPSISSESDSYRELFSVSLELIKRWLPKNYRHRDICLMLNGEDVDSW
jgi:hypothetical protein